MKNIAVNLYPGNGLRGLGNLADPGNGIDLFAKFMSTAIGFMTIIAIIWFVFVFITGALGIMNAGGDKQAMEGSRKKISMGLIGLVIVIIAVFVFDLIGYLLGFGSGGLLNITNLFNIIQVR